MPAGWTELSESQSSRVGALPAQAQRRADRRAEQKVERRSRQRLAIACCVVLTAFFGLTVAILELLH